MFRCESRKQSISRLQTEVRCSAGVCTWAFSIHGLFCGYRGDSEETWHQILQACFRELKQLLTTLKLKLNDCKTEFLVLMSPHQLRKYGLPVFQLGTVLIKPAVSVRNLGAHFDQMLTMVSFINHKIKVASYHLRRIGSIRKYITAGICHKLVVALVTSNIDYCNGLLGGLAAKDVDRLQRLQNRAARLVTRSKAAMHKTPIHKDLHWLPIQERINYKIIVTV